MSGAASQGSIITSTEYTYGLTYLNLTELPANGKKEGKEGRKEGKEREGKGRKGSIR